MPDVETFHWTDTQARLDALGSLAVDADRKTLITDALVIHPPLVLGFPGPAGVPAWLASLPDELGRELVVLLQAGAAALGLWEDDALMRHKVLRTYAVRGRGRAQSLHLKTKGKSRYGSRLRLRNARNLLVELSELLGEWRELDGPIDRVFLSAPVTIRGELFRTTPAPPFGREDATPIPLDVHAPRHRELLRVRGFLTHGRITRRPPR